MADASIAAAVEAKDSRLALHLLALSLARALDARPDAALPDLIAAGRELRQTLKDLAEVSPPVSDPEAQRLSTPVPPAGAGGVAGA